MERVIFWGVDLYGSTTGKQEKKVKFMLYSCQLSCKSTNLPSRPLELLCRPKTHTAAGLSWVLALSFYLFSPNLSFLHLIPREPYSLWAVTFNKVLINKATQSSYLQEKMSHGGLLKSKTWEVNQGRLWPFMKETLKLLPVACSWASRKHIISPVKLVFPSLY